MALKLARLSVGWSLYSQLHIRLHVTGEVTAVHVSNAPNKGGQSGGERLLYRGFTADPTRLRN